MVPSPALVAAVDGEDDLAAGVLEGVCRATDPLLVLGQWVLTVLREGQGLSGCEAVVVVIVVNLLDQAEWLGA